MINYQNTLAPSAICSPCQVAAMAHMTIPQRLAFMKNLGLTTELAALEKQLAETGYKIPSPSGLPNL